MNDWKWGGVCGFGAVVGINQSSLIWHHCLMGVKNVSTTKNLCEHPEKNPLSALLKKGFE